MVEKKVLEFGWAFGEEERGKNRVFHAEEHIYNLQISLSKLVSLSESSLFTLSVRIHAECNSLYSNSHSVQFPLRLELHLAR